MTASFDPTFAASVGHASAVTAIVLARLLIPRFSLVIIGALVRRIKTG